MKYLFILFCYLPFIVNSQDTCTVCPAGSPIGITSTFPINYAHSWTCTNGFTSTQRNPTLNPTENTTCTLVVTDAAGCTNQTQVLINVCSCDDNNPCVSANFTPAVPPSYFPDDILTVTKNGNTPSPIATDVMQWRHTNPVGAWNTYVGNNFDLSGCTIKEYINSGPYTQIAGANFKFTVSGIAYYNFCSGSCTDLRIIYQFPVGSYNSTDVIGCGGAAESSYQISPANLLAAGGFVDIFVTLTTTFGVVVNQYRFTYNGAGLSVPNITGQIINIRRIYKDIEIRRIVTYADGCPSDTCSVVVDIPQVPPLPCTNFSTTILTQTLPNPCSGSGLSASNTNNGTPPYTYQWKRDGSVLVGATAMTYCLVGQPSGNYCVRVTDAASCTFETCTQVQPPCTLGVTVAATGSLLNTTLTGCGGGATYQWQVWTNGTSWENIAFATTSSYTHPNITAQYRVVVVCGGCTAIGLFNYTAPCTANVSVALIGNTTIRATVTNCGGTSINYRFYIQISGSWFEISQVTTTNTTQDFTPVSEGIHKVVIICNGCVDEDQIPFVPINPCVGFTATITGAAFSGICRNSTTVYSISAGGVAPYTQTWRLNNVVVGTGATYSFTPATIGTYTLTATVVDALNCTYTDTKILSVIQCCGASVSITPTTPTACTNQTTTFLAVGSGGTAPYTYSWSSQLTGGAFPVLSEGSGSTKGLTFVGAGVYTISVRVTDANGCIATNSTTLTVTTCTDCTCVPSWALTGCNLTASFTGSGCPASFQYQIQYSPVGAGWTVLQNGFANAPVNYTPTLNGYYRLLIFKTGCSGNYVTDIVVNCIITCGCTAGVLTKVGCELRWTNPCSGYTATLQKLITGVWTYVTQTNNYIIPLATRSSYDGFDAGTYRVLYQRASCADVIGNTVSIVNSALVTVTRSSAPPIFSPYHWQYIGVFVSEVTLDNTYVLCLEDNERYLYGVRASAVATPPNFYTNTFTAITPVTWTITHLNSASLANVTVLVQNSTTLTLKFQWLLNNISSVTTCSNVSTPDMKYKFKLTATDGCGRIIYTVYAEASFGV